MAPIRELLENLTVREPKSPDAQGPLLLARPKFYGHVLLHNPGVAIVTGYYGYGKTYGFGLNTYHRVRGVETCGEFKLSKKVAVIYVNLSYAKSAMSEPVEQQLARALWKPLTDASLYEGLRRSAQFYATIDVSQLKLGEGVPPNLKELFLELYYTLGNEYSTLYLIFDEFEQLYDNPKSSDVAQVVRIVANSYRSGGSVGEVAPDFLKVILLVQKAIYSEEEVRKALGDIAASGRVLKLGNRFGIPVEYTPQALLEYLKCAVSVVRRRGLADEGIAEALLEFLEGPDRELAMYLDAMAELPGLVVFKLLADAVSNALASKSPVEELKRSIAVAARIYGVEALARKTILPVDEETEVDMTRALERLARETFGDVLTVAVKKYGYYATVALRDNEADVFVYRHSKFNKATFLKFVEEVKRVVGDRKRVRWTLLYAKPIRAEEAREVVKDVRLRPLSPKEYYALYFTASSGLLSVEGISRMVDEVVKDLAAELRRGRL